MVDSIKLKLCILIPATLLVAFFLTLLPFPVWMTFCLPNWVLLVLMFLALVLDPPPLMGLTFVSGIIVDLLQGTLMGEHAFAYVVAIYLFVKLRARFIMLQFWQKIFFVGLISLFFQGVVFGIQGLRGLPVQANLYWLSSVFTAAFWPWVFYLLSEFYPEMS